MPEPRVGRPRRILRLFPLNPAFGAGAFRRRLRLRHASGVVTAVLDDNNHAMWLRLKHDGVRVTFIASGYHRPPTTGCLGATEVLAELAGTPITASRQQLFADRRARRHCTHLFDLFVSALASAVGAEGERVWDAVVPDPVDDCMTARLTLNGALVHEWRMRDYVIQPDDGSPPQTLLSGFGPWAAARFQGDALEGATILRMAAFTARARAHITDDADRPLTDFPERHGACHAYRSPQLETARHYVGVVRDFSTEVAESAWPDER